MTKEELSQLLEDIAVDLKDALALLEKYEGPKGGYSDLRQLKSLIAYIYNEAKDL